ISLLVWVNLKQIPDCCYSKLGISHIASGLGKPILTHKPRLDLTNIATIQDPIYTAHDSTLNPTASSEVCIDNLKTTTLFFSSPSPLEKPAAPLTSASSPDTLVDSQSTPTATPIMDCYQSNITNNEVIESLVVDLITPTPIHCAFESPSRFSVLGNVDEAEIEAPNSISLTRGGRESKTPIKYQSMEWKTVRGRGKRGRGGRVATLCLLHCWTHITRDVKQVYPSRSVPYRSGLAVERVTAGLFRADCGLQNIGPNPYHRIYRSSRAVPRDTSLSNRLLQFLS
ncbi:hypothetical protein IGI04_031725, partial [Brassica rapa subsp. trilocularis]